MKVRIWYGVAAMSRDHTMVGHGRDADFDAPRRELDGARAMALGEGKERIRHEILRVPHRELAGESVEQIELAAF